MKKSHKDKAKCKQLIPFLPFSHPSSLFLLCVRTYEKGCLAICLRLFIIIQYRYYLMHKLFVLSHLRTLQRLGVTEYSPANFEEIKTRNTLAPSSEALLYRLPREELKHIMNTQCPINSLEQANAEPIIQSSKALRHHTKIEEGRICSKCPFVKECKHASKPWQGQKYENTIFDLLNYFHGLHQILKPENIYYRQWVSAYRLGDSIIASIDDLSKGAKEIEEYDAIRLDGKKHFQERMAQKKNSEKDEENQDKQFQRVMSKVETISSEKRKTEKPKEEPKPKVAESFGRDFSFDEELEFQPVKKFNKKIVEAEQTKPIQSQKGYQKIENQERSAKPKTSYYNKQRSQQDQDEGEFKRYQPKQGYQGNKTYEDRGYKKEWNGAQRSDNRYQNDSNNRYGNNKPEYQGNRYNGDQQGNKYSRPDYQNNKYSNNSYEQKGKYGGEQQGRYSGEQQQNNRYNDRRGNEQYQNNKFTPKPRYDDEEGFPKINELGKRNANQFSKPRDNYNQEQQTTKIAPKTNPFVSKWKDSSQQQEPRDSFASKPRKSESSAYESQPKIVSVQSANEESAESKRGRLVRRRRRSGEDEE